VSPFRMALVVCVALAAPARAIVVVDSNITFGGSMPAYGIGIWQDAARTTDTSISFKFDGTMLKDVVTAADEGADLYLVQPGAVFGEQSILNGQFPMLGTTNIAQGDFYLGVATGIGAEHIDKLSRTAFGLGSTEKQRIKFADDQECDCL
jgi:hypothetical protein